MMRKTTLKKEKNNFRKRRPVIRQREKSDIIKKNIVLIDLNAFIENVLYRTYCHGYFSSDSWAITFSSDPLNFNLIWEIYVYVDPFNLLFFHFLNVIFYSFSTELFYFFVLFNGLSPKMFRQQQLPK